MFGVALLTACGAGLQPLPPARAPAPVPVSRPATTTASRPAIPDDDVALASRELMVPVDGVGPSQVPDSYGASRGAQGERMHNALDIMAPRGTRVVAADGGKVGRLSRNDLGGITIYTVDDEQRFVYYYAHLDRYAEGLREGQAIAKGDLLGYVGTTGNAPSNVPHLHFQVMRYRGDARWWDGDPLNPHRFLSQPGRVNRK